jgi:hypothetical protein
VRSIYREVLWRCTPVACFGVAWALYWVSTRPFPHRIAIAPSNVANRATQLIDDRLNELISWGQRGGMQRNTCSKSVHDVFQWAISYLEQEDNRPDLPPYANAGNKALTTASTATAHTSALLHGGSAEQSFARKFLLKALQIPTFANLYAKYVETLDVLGTPWLAHAAHRSKRTHRSKPFATVLAHRNVELGLQPKPTRSWWRWSPNPEDDAAFHNLLQDVANSLGPEHRANMLHITKLWIRQVKRQVLLNKPGWIWSDEAQTYVARKATDFWRRVESADATLPLSARAAEDIARTTHNYIRELIRSTEPLDGLSLEKATNDALAKFMHVNDALLAEKGLRHVTMQSIMHDFGLSTVYLPFVYLFIYVTGYMFWLAVVWGIINNNPRSFATALLDLHQVHPVMIATRLGQCVSHLIKALLARRTRRASESNTSRSSRSSRSSATVQVAQ